MEDTSLDKPNNGENISLPEPEINWYLSLEETLQQRRSIREYTQDKLSKEDIAQLLWAAQWLNNTEKRTAPSAGATYPMEIFIAIDKAEKLDPGIYHYNNYENTLEQISKWQVGDKLSMSALGQDPIKDAAANIIITADFERTTSVYWSRWNRYVYMEAGHISQNIYLQAESLDIGTVAIGAFDDEDIQNILWVDEYQPVYIMPIGYK